LRANRSLVLLLALGAFNMACASFRTGDLDRDVTLATAQEPKPSIAVVVTGRATLGNRPTQDVPSQATAAWRQEVLDAYHQSGLFSSVDSGFRSADLRAEVDVHNTGNPNIGLAILSGLTLTLIPANAVDTFHMTTVFRNAEGDELITVERSAVVSTWIQLFLLPVMPFKSPRSTVEGAFEDLVMHTLAGAGDVVAAPASEP
jgi:hypothetical protein